MKLLSDPSNSACSLYHSHFCFSVLVLIGVPFLILAVYAISAGEKEGGIFLVPALLFGGIGGLVGYFTSRPRVFDLAAGWFWVGRKPISTTKVKRNNNCAPLKMVHALQIVREIVTSEGDQSSTSFNSYELNLVLNDGSRINVIDHGDIDKIRTDSARLSKFLNVPVWDATL